MSVLEKLRSFSESKYLKLTVGLILLGSGLHEAWETLAEDLSNLNVGAHHGVMVLGVFHILQTLPDIIVGLKHVKDED